MVPLVLHPQGIVPSFLKLDSWSTRSGFIPIFINQKNKLDKERKIVRKKKVLCIQKELIHF